MESNQANTKRSPTGMTVPSYQNGRGYSDLPGNVRQDSGTPPLGCRGPQLPNHTVHDSVSTPIFAGVAHQEGRLLACRRFSRAVRVLAILDGVVVLYGASAFMPLILMLWGPVAGYMSSYFRLKAAYTFLFYCCLRVSWDIGWLLTGGTAWIAVWLFLVTDTAASALVYVYSSTLRKCTLAEVHQLRDPDVWWRPALFPLVDPGSPPSSFA